MPSKAVITSFLGKVYFEIEDFNIMVQAISLTVLSIMTYIVKSYEIVQTWTINF